MVKFFLFLLLWAERKEHAMKWTKTLIQTLRDDPQDAEIDSHKLLVRASLVKKVSGGLYTFLPLGLRAFRKVENMMWVL